MSSSVAPRSETSDATARAAGARLHYDLGLALHAAVASKLDDDIVLRARSRVEEWLTRSGGSAPLLRRWREILALPLDSIRAFLVDPGEEAAWLRKASPFAGALGAREREEIVRRVRRGRAR